MKGFKNFLMRGDVIVVAVGLVVALATHVTRVMGDVLCVRGSGQGGARVRPGRVPGVSRGCR